MTKMGLVACSVMRSKTSGEAVTFEKWCNLEWGDCDVWVRYLEKRMKARLQREIHDPDSYQNEHGKLSRCLHSRKHD